MLKEYDCHVKSAEQIAIAISQLLGLKSHDDANGVQLVFAGLNAHGAAGELAAKARGRILVLPTFKVVEEEIQLQRLLVLDGLSLPGRTMITGCDLVRHDSGLCGLLTQGPIETYSYILDGSRAIIFYDVRRPYNASKIIKAGARALAAKVRKVRPLAA